MKTDPEIRKDVIAELAWEPRVESGDIDIEVTDGQVTLSGKTDSYSKKMYAEMAVSGINGVTGITNNLQVELPEQYRRSDEEIEDTIKRAFRWSSSIPWEKIRISVKDGAVELFGDVEWELQKRRARRIAEDIIGVRSVTNSILIKSPSPASGDLKEKVSSALQRSLNFNETRVHIETNGSTVILSGKVNSVSEKNRAERAALSSSGVTEVQNNLQVSFTKPYFEQGSV